jgi:hypothetical protein
MIRFYLSAIRLYGIDRNLDISIFKNEYLSRLVRGAVQLFSSSTRPRLPITRDILRRMIPTLSSPELLDEVNVSAALRIGWAAMARLGKITYKRQDIIADKIIKRGDVSLRNKHAVLRLRHSKTDIKKRGIDILLAATDDELYPVRALEILF